MDIFELYTYGGGDFMRLILNGVASIFGNGDYIVAMRTAALIGFLGMLLSAAFMKDRIDVKWFFAIIMVYLIAVVPKVKVSIIDRVIPANSAIVDNIPLGVGATASMFSVLGDWTTRTFETVFSMPNEVQYSGNGLLFASGLVEESTRFTITTPRIKENFSDFWKSCVYYDLLLELYSWDDLVKSKNLMGFFTSKTSETRSFTYKGANNRRIILGCRAGIGNQMRTDLNAEIQNASNVYGARLIPSETTRTQAVTRFASSMPIAYRYLTGLSLTHSQIIGQNVLANSFKRGLINFASEADAPAAAEDFALARAESERNVTFAVMGKVAKKMLPMLKNLFEAGIYALFPIVVLISLVAATGKVAIGFAKVVLWVNLWAPLYAILHFAVSYYTQQAASAAVVQSGGGFSTGLTLLTNSGLGATLGDYANVAHSLSLSIPMISWLCVQLSGTMMSGLAGRIMQSFDQPVSKAADEISGGNVNLGNTKYQTSSAFQSNAAPSESAGFFQHQGSDAVTNTITSNGTYMDAPSSNLPMNMNFSSMATSSSRESLSNAVSHEQSTAASNVESNGILRSEINSLASRVQESGSSSQSWNTSEGRAFSQARQDTDRFIEQWSERNGLSLDDTKRAMGEGYFKVESSGGFHIPFTEKNEATVTDGVAGKTEKTEATVTGGVAGKLGLDYKKVSKDDYEKVQQMMSSNEFNQVLKAEGNAARSFAGSLNTGYADSSENSLSSALQRQESSSMQHSDAMKNVEQATRQYENSEQIGATITQKGMDGFINWMTDDKGLPNSFVKNMVVDANNGNLDSANQLQNLAKEYVAGHFPANNSVGGFDRNEELISSSATESISGIMRQFSNDRLGSELPSKSQVEGLISNQVLQTEVAIAEPEGHLMMPNSLSSRKDEVNQKQSAVKDRVEEEQGKSVWDQVSSRLFN